jgi:NAD(P)H-flavin reductase
MGTSMLAEPQPPPTREPMTPMPCRVLEMRKETADTVTLAIEPPPGSPFAFRAGQFNMLYAFGIGEVPISISGDPTRPGAVWHTVREVGKVSGALVRAPVGSTIGLRGPYGSEWPVNQPGQRDILIVAGGVGMAPLRPAVYQVLAQRERYGRVVLLYGARTPNDLLFRDELSVWRGRFDVEVLVTVDNALANWRGNVGVVPGLLQRATFDTAGAVALVVGPEIMMRFTISALADLGVTSDRIYVSMERNMRCAVGTCGHCQLGPWFVCRDGPVFRYDMLAPWLRVREL